jgi:hypothetical protein
MNEDQQSRGRILTPLYQAEAVFFLCLALGLPQLVFSETKLEDLFKSYKYWLFMGGTIVITVIMYNLSKRFPHIRRRLLVGTIIVGLIGSVCVIQKATNHFIMANKERHKDSTEQVK